MGVCSRCAAPPILKSGVKMQQSGDGDITIRGSAGEQLSSNAARLAGSSRPMQRRIPRASGSGASHERVRQRHHPMRMLRTSSLNGRRSCSATCETSTPFGSKGASAARVSLLADANGSGEVLWSLRVLGRRECSAAASGSPAGGGRVVSAQHWEGFIRHRDGLRDLPEATLKTPRKRAALRLARNAVRPKLPEVP